MTKFKHLNLMKYLLLFLLLFSADTLAIDRIIVLKSERIMLFIDNDRIVKEYKISLGKNPVGDKRYQGDNKTPEGVYFITHKNPQSRFYLSLGISYPNKNDIREARTLGKSAGGDIMIHGLPNRVRNQPNLHYLFNGMDWTRGCIAVQNYEMKEIYNIVKVGTVIDIRK